MYRTYRKHTTNRQTQNIRKFGRGVVGWCSYVKCFGVRDCIRKFCFIIERGKLLILYLMLCILNEAWTVLDALQVGGGFTAVSNRQNWNYETPRNRGVQKTIFGIQDGGRKPNLENTKISCFQTLIASSILNKIK